MIEGPPFPRPWLIVWACLALSIAQMPGWFPKWLAATIDVLFACAGSYALGLLSERKRRYQDSIEHHEEMVRMHRATQAFITDIQARIEGLGSREDRQ